MIDEQTVIAEQVGFLNRIREGSLMRVTIKEQEIENIQKDIETEKKNVIKCDVLIKKLTS